MFYKYWKNFALAVTAFFWAGCEDSVSQADCLYGPPEYYGITSSESGDPQSSSDVVGSSSEMASSSSNFDPNGMPSDTLYGVSVTEKTCVPGDSVVSYYPPAYSADILKMNAKQQAEMEIVELIDSIVDPRPKAERIEAPLDSINWSNFPQCLKRMRESLERFVALYGAPENFPMEWVCSDGTTRPTEEYQKYQKMMEEWEANKPALDEEINKIIEDRFKELEEQLNKCLNNSNGEGNA